MRDAGPHPADSGLPEPFAALEARRRGSRLGHTVLWRSHVDSTNAWARRLLAGGARQGTLVVADAQRAGRGRHGRRWESPSGLGLYSSVLLKPRLDGPRLGLLALAAGVAAARAVRRLGRVPAQLQWPNDLMLRQRKLGGILLESSSAGGRQEMAVLGWGLNLGQRREDFPLHLRRRATSLLLEGGRAAGRAALLHAFLGALEALVAELEAGKRRPLLRRFGALAPGCEGRILLVEVDGRRRRALSRGLEEDGSLRVELPEGLRILRGAELLRIVEM